jgi:hypothetical protein
VLQNKYPGLGLVPFLSQLLVTAHAPVGVEEVRVVLCRCVLVFVVEQVVDGIFKSIFKIIFAPKSKNAPKIPTKHFIAYFCFLFP